MDMEIDADAGETTKALPLLLDRLAKNNATLSKKEGEGSGKITTVFALFTAHAPLSAHRWLF